MRFRILALVLVILGLVPDVRAEDAKPLAVLWCTGGGYHDYKNLTPQLTQAIRKYAHVRCQG